MGNRKSVYSSELSHSMVHYLLTIHKLREERGFARVTDIARELNLTKGSVSTALNNLKKKEYVKEEEGCKFLILTDKGHDEVHSILSSRTLLFYFLKDFLAVRENIAARDSCLMEHLMSQETRKKLFDFMYSLVCSQDKSSALEKFANLRSELDLCEFKDEQDFIERQKGDKHLVSEKKELN